MELAKLIDKILQDYSTGRIHLKKILNNNLSSKIIVDKKDIENMIGKYIGINSHSPIYEPAFGEIIYDLPLKEVSKKL